MHLTLTQSPDLVELGFSQGPDLAGLGQFNLAWKGKEQSLVSLKVALQPLHLVTIAAEI